MGADGTLVIRNTEEKDGGVYRCLASNVAGTDTTNSILTYIGEFHVHTRGWGGVPFRSSDPAHVNLFFYTRHFLESPVVTVALSDILVGVGEAAVLACAASGTPQPEIWWYKGNPTNCSHKWQRTVYVADTANESRYEIS